MTKQQLLADLAKIDGFGLQQYFEADYEGSCPCFDGELEVDGYKLAVTGKCWRVSEDAQDLVVETSHPDAVEIAEAIKRPLDAQEWYNPYTVHLLREGE